MAADEQIGEADILSSQMVSEPGQNQPDILSYIRFLFAHVSISLRPVIVKAHKPKITGKGFAPMVKPPAGLPWGRQMSNSTFVIIVLSLHPSGAIV
jgi:hypothetical protein